jgi:hypothetical protein
MLKMNVGPMNIIMIRRYNRRKKVQHRRIWSQCTINTGLRSANPLTAKFGNNNVYDVMLIITEDAHDIYIGFTHQGGYLMWYTEGEGHWIIDNNIVYYHVGPIIITSTQSKFIIDGVTFMAEPGRITLNRGNDQLSIDNKGISYWDNKSGNGFINPNASIY